ncbi:MAG: CBS domain-containing protein [Candidatus Helarchaeota archaeon]
MSIKDIKANEIMVKNPISIPPAEQIAAADLLMTRNNIGGLPVTDLEGNLVGLISLRDIMLSRFTISVGGMKVEDIMEKNLKTVSPNTSLKEVLKIMLENRIERIPVVENGKLLGLIVHKEILKEIYNKIK